MMSLSKDKTGLDHTGVPFIGIVAGDTVIYAETGDISMKQIEKQLAKIDSVMPGPRVGAADFAKFKKAKELAKTTGKEKDAKDAFAAILKKKLPEKFKAAVEKELAGLDGK